MIAGSKVKISSETVKGCGFPPSFILGSTNEVINLPLSPAGCIVLPFVDWHKDPLEGCQFRIKMDPGNNISQTVSVGETMTVFEPAKLGVRYQVEASKDALKYKSRWFSLNAKHPVKKLTCVLK